MRGLWPQNEATCLGNSDKPTNVTYNFSRAKVTSTSRADGRFSTQGGTFNYGARGNRSSGSVNAPVVTFEYSDGGVADRLLATSSNEAAYGGRGPRIEYSYDDEGRVLSQTWPKEASGLNSLGFEFAPGTVNGMANGGLDSVYKAVSVNGAVYSYFYDANNHRRLKVYPTGAKDEFFYTPESQLWVDIGNEKLWQSVFHPVDEYIWVGGKPLLVIRGRLDNDYMRQSDSSASCARNGEARSCGMFALVHDILPRPALALDEAGKVAATFEFQAFGQVNRIETPALSLSRSLTPTGFVNPVSFPIREPLKVDFRYPFDDHRRLQRLTSGA